MTVINKFNAKSIYESFYSVLKYSNYKVLKCYKLVLKLNSLTKNIGSIITIVYFLVFFIFLIIYVSKGINQLIVDFSNISPKSIKNSNIKAKNKQNIKIENKKQDNKLILKNTKYKKNNNKFIKYKNPPKKFIKKISKINEPEFNSKNKFINSKNKYDNYNNCKNIIISKNSKKPNIFNKNNINIKKIIINKQINNNIFINNKGKEQLDYYEINNLEYALAKKLDKRNFFQIYWSLLKREHSIIFTFITRDDHNIIFVKYSKFIFLLCTDMAMNVFFFSDETMHKMFLDYGKYNFIQQIPQIFYSTLISKLLEIFLCFLSMTDKYYYEIKGSKKILIEI